MNSQVPNKIQIASTWSAKCDLCLRVLFTPPEPSVAHFITLTLPHFMPVRSSAIIQIQFRCDRDL